MRWTEDQTVRFVCEFVNYECLYNINSPDFRSKPIRDAALQKLSSNMNMSGFGPTDAYNKMRSIKSTYSQELKKIKYSENSGIVYTPNMKWFNILHDVLMPLNITERKLETSFDASTSNSPNQYNIKRRTRKRSLLTKPSTANSISNTLENEFDIFGKSVAAQLKNMPLDVAIESQMFIQSYLSDMRLRTLQRCHDQTSQSNYCLSQESPNRTFPGLVLEYNEPSDISNKVFLETKHVAGEKCST